MNTKLILYILKNGTYYLYNFMILLIIGFIIYDGYRLFYDKKNEFIEFDRYTFTSKFDHSNDLMSNPKLSNDKNVEYESQTDLYKLKAKVNSPLGIYYMIFTLMSISVAILMLWVLNTIFKKINLNEPFKVEIVKKLKLLAVIFILYDILDLINYFILNQLLKESGTSIKLILITDIGSSTITGLIILIIAMVYQRGVEIEEESCLTV